MHLIGEVEDIDTANETKLEGLGIRTTDDYLARAATPSARSELASAVGVGAEEILRWANCADLMRVDGIGMQFADLLEAAGVDTIPELGQRNAANLHAKLVEVNGAKQLTGRMPTAAEVETWVAQAKSLPRILEYSGDGPAAGAEAIAAAAPAAAAPVEPAPAATVPLAAAPAPPPAPTETASYESEVANEKVAPLMSSASADSAPATSWLQRLIAKVRGQA